MAFPRVIVVLLVAGIDAVAALPNKSYTTWFPIYHKMVEKVFDKACTTDLAAYELNSNHVTCQPLVSCIIGHFSQIQNSASNSASVLLGVTPTLLATIGPSAAEIALLSTHRPFMSLLLSLGAPSIYPSRPMEYTDPLECLRTHAVPNKKLVVEAFARKRTIYAVSLIQYCLAFAATANTIHTAWLLGRNTVMQWRCNSTLYPLLWVMSTLAVHILGVLSYRLSRTSRLSRSQHRKPPPSRWPVYGTLRYWWASEIMPCANHEKPKLVVADEPFGVLLLNWATTILGVVQVVFGTLILSSLLFISILYSLYVLLRFLASALVCRSMVAFEISGLRSLDPSEAAHEPGSGDLSEVQMQDTPAKENAAVSDRRKSRKHSI